MFVAVDTRRGLGTRQLTPFTIINLSSQLEYDEYRL